MMRFFTEMALCVVHTRHHQERLIRRYSYV